MMGERRSGQEALFYEFSLEDHVPADHLLRRIDQLIDFSEVRAHLKPYYSETGRPSICPELMIRMLIAGYCFGIRSERRLCDEVHLNLAYRWFCRLGLEGAVPDHSTFSKNRHGRFRESDLFRTLFDQVLRRCMAAGLVGGEAFSVDGSLVAADADRRKGPTGEAGLPPDKTSRAIDEYLTVLDDAAFGAASEKTPKFLSETDPAARYPSAHNAPALYGYAVNYLIDNDHGVIVDVEATTAIRQAEVEAAKRMLDRAEDRHGLYPERLAGDTGYGSGPMLEWLVEEKGIEPRAIQAPTMPRPYMAMQS
ncbi:MAG: IS1182 family transposase, partial [Pseudomonadota bacterium]